MPTMYFGSDSIPASFVGVADASFPGNEYSWYRFIESFNTVITEGIVSYACKHFVVTSYSAPMNVSLRVGSDLLGVDYSTPSAEDNFSAHNDAVLVSNFDIDGSGSYDIFMDADDLNLSGNTDFRTASLNEAGLYPANKGLIRVGMQSNSDEEKHARIDVLIIYEHTPTVEINPNEEITPTEEITATPYFNYSVPSNYDAQVWADIDDNDPIRPEES